MQQTFYIYITKRKPGDANLVHRSAFSREEYNSIMRRSAPYLNYSFFIIHYSLFIDNSVRSRLRSSADMLPEPADPFWCSNPPERP